MTLVCEPSINKYAHGKDRQQEGYWKDRHVPCMPLACTYLSVAVPNPVILMYRAVCTDQVIPFSSNEAVLNPTNKQSSVISLHKSAGIGVFKCRGFNLWFLEHFTKNQGHGSWNTDTWAQIWGRLQSCCQTPGGAPVLPPCHVPNRDISEQEMERVKNLEVKHPAGLCRRKHRSQSSEWFPDPHEKPVVPQKHEPTRFYCAQLKSVEES